MRLSLDWRRAALAGLAAGVVATVAEIGLWFAFSEPLPTMLFRDARLAAAIVLGPKVLPPPSSFDATVFMTATLLHAALSILYGLTLSAMITRLGRRPSLSVGAVFGLLLFAINMYAFTIIFPWFEATRDWITLLTHVIFGVVVAAVYKLQLAPISQSP